MGAFHLLRKVFVAASGCLFHAKTCFRAVSSTNVAEAQLVFFVQFQTRCTEKVPASVSYY